MKNIKFDTSKEGIDFVKSQTDTVVLSFSGGKDAIACWLRIREEFKTIIPVYFYIIPDLEFVEEALRYYEDFFKTKIYRIPHPSLYRMIKYGVYQPHWRYEEIDNWGLEEFTYREAIDWLCEDYGFGKNLWTVIGTRKNDSIIRRVFFNRHGPVHYGEKKLFPIMDLSKQDLIDLFEKEKIHLPIDYKIFGRSFDGIDYRFLKPIKKHFPRDYERIKELFPLVDVEIFRAEVVNA